MMNPFVGRIVDEPGMKAFGVVVDGRKVYVKVPASDPRWLWWWFRIEVSISTGCKWDAEA